MSIHPVASQLTWSTLVNERQIKSSQLLLLLLLLLLLFVDNELVRQFVSNCPRHSSIDHCR